MAPHHQAFLEPSRVVLLFLQKKNKQGYSSPCLQWLEIIKSLMSYRGVNLEKHFPPWMAVQSARVLTVFLR